MMVPRITKEDVKRRLDAGEHILFVDARSPEAWEGSNEMIPGAIRVPADEVERHLTEIPSRGPVVAYCT